MIGFLKAELVESNGEECPRVVTDICASSDGSLVAVAIQRQVLQHFGAFLIIFGCVVLTCLLFRYCSLHGVMLMCCNFSARTLSVSKVRTLERKTNGTSIVLSLVEASE